MRFFLLELRARRFEAVIATSLDGKRRRAIPLRRRRIDAKRLATNAIEGVEFLRGLRGGECRECDLGLGELSFAIFCESRIPLAELACEHGGERPPERLIDGYRMHPALDAHPVELAANHFGNR